MPQPKFWLKLDNAGKIFPGQNTTTWSNIFRCTLLLKTQIQPEVLEQALRDVLPRFPCYDVRLRSGLFWNYFEKNPNGAPPVREDINNPCYRVRFNENNRYLFRVYYRANRLSVEFYHALSDGAGATVFLCTLAAQYLRLLGQDIPTGGFILDITQPATQEELEDPFPSTAGRSARSNRTTRPVYHAKGTPLPAHTVSIITGIMPMDRVRALAKTYGATVTEFFGALLMFVLYEKQRSEHRRQKDVSVQIPVNLRKPFHRTSLRNYTLTYTVRMDPTLGEYTFEEVLRQFMLYLRYINNEKNLRAMTAANLKLEGGIMRYIPLFVKNFGIGLSFRLTGEHSTTVLCSNLGKVDLPQEMRDSIERIDFMAGPGKINSVRCACAGVNNVLSFTFTGICRETNIEREFFTRLIKMGIPVKIETNRN